MSSADEFVKEKAESALRYLSSEDRRTVEAYINTQVERRIKKRDLWTKLVESISSSIFPLGFILATTVIIFVIIFNGYHANVRNTAIINTRNEYQGRIDEQTNLISILEGEKFSAIKDLEKIKNACIDKIICSSN